MALLVTEVLLEFKALEEPKEVQVQEALEE